MRSVAFPLAVLASGVASLAEAVDIALEKCVDNAPIDSATAYSEVEIFALDSCVNDDATTTSQKVKLDTGVYKMFKYTGAGCNENDVLGSETVSLASGDSTACSTGNGYTHNLVSDNFSGVDDLLSADYAIVEGTHGSADTNCDTPSTSYTRYHVNVIDACVENVKLTNDTNTYTLTTYTAPTGSEVACATAPEGTAITFVDGDCNEVGDARMKYYEYEAPTDPPTVPPTVPTVPPTPAPTEPLTKVALEKCVDNAPIVPGEAYSEVDILTLGCVTDESGTGYVKIELNTDNNIYQKTTSSDGDCDTTDDTADTPVLFASGNASIDCSSGNGYTHNLVSANFSGVDDLLSENYTIVEALFEGAIECPVDTEVTSYTRYHSEIVGGACVDDKMVTYDDVSKEYTVTMYEAATDANAAGCETATANTDDNVKFQIDVCLDSTSDSMMYYKYVATTDAPTDATDAPTDATDAPTDATEYAVFHKCDGEVLMENPKVLIVRALDTCQGSGTTFTKLVRDSGNYTEYTHTTAACDDTTPDSVTFFAKDGDCTGHDQVPVETMNLEEPVTADYPVAVLKYSGENCTEGGMPESLDLYHSNFTSGNCTNKATLEVNGTRYNLTAYSDDECSQGAVLTSYEEDTCMNKDGSSSMLVAYSHDDHDDHANGSGHVALSTFSLILIAAATLL